MNKVKKKYKYLFKILLDILLVIHYNLKLYSNIFVKDYCTPSQEGEYRNVNSRISSTLQSSTPSYKGEYRNEYRNLITGRIYDKVNVLPHARESIKNNRPPTWRSIKIYCIFILFQIIFNQVSFSPSLSQIISSNGPYLKPI